MEIVLLFIIMGLLYIIIECARSGIKYKKKQQSAARKKVFLRSGAAKRIRSSPAPNLEQFAEDWE